MQPAIHTHPWHDRRHHRPGGFRNVWPPPRDASVLRALGWLLRRPFARKRNLPPAVRPLDGAALAVPPARLRVTWLGHAAALIQTPTLNVVTDPMFGRRASPFAFAGPRREAPLPLRPEALPPVHVVLLSHDHYDHLDRASVEALARRHDPLFVTPLGVAGHLHRWGLRRAVALDWGQHVAVEGLSFHCTPAKHFSGRGLRDRDATLWASWYLTAADLRLYFGADSGYADHYAAIRARHGAPEVALLPIGAYRPRWLMQPVHVDPDETVQALLDLEAAHLIPIHWGTFDLADEPLHEPPERLLKAAARLGIARRVHLLPPGGTFDPDAL